MRNVPKLSRIFRNVALFVLTTASLVTGDSTLPKEMPPSPLQETQLTLVTNGAFNRHGMTQKEMVSWPKRQTKALADPTVRKAYELWLSDLMCLKDTTLMAKAVAVNAFVNQNVRYTSDSALYNAFDYFAPAAKTALFRRGDCEDIAIAKYDALHRLGVPNSRLRLLVVATDSKKRLPDHCALAVDTSAANDWTDCLVLNNFTFETSPSTVSSIARIQDTGFKPYIAINDSMIANVELKQRPVLAR